MLLVIGTSTKANACHPDHPTCIKSWRHLFVQLTCDRPQTGRAKVELRRAMHNPARSSVFDRLGVQHRHCLIGWLSCGVEPPPVCSHLGGGEQAGQSHLILDACRLGSLLCRAATPPRAGTAPRGRASGVDRGRWGPGTRAAPRPARADKRSRGALVYLGDRMPHCGPLCRADRLTDVPK